jgi:hypothetical protein
VAAHDRGDAGEGVSVGKKEGDHRMECIRPLVLNKHSPSNIERYLKSHTCGHVSFVKKKIYSKQAVSTGYQFLSGTPTKQNNPT